MRTKSKRSGGYALITTIAVMTVMMALCSMLVAYSFYGRALSQSVAMRFDRNRGYSESESEFLSMVRLYGDDLLDAYRAKGFAGDGGTVEKTSKDGGKTIISREANTARELRTITLVLYAGTGKEKKETISVISGDSPAEKVRGFETGYTDAREEHWYFAGWNCDGSKTRAEYDGADALPAAEEDVTYTAVYSRGTPFTVCVTTPEGITTEIPYYAGETLGNVLDKTYDETDGESEGGSGKAYFTHRTEDEKSEMYRYFTKSERDIGGVLERTLTAGDAESLRKVLLNSEAGDTIRLTGELDEPVLVDRAVTIVTPTQTEKLSAADGYVMTEAENDGWLYRFERMACVFVQDTFEESVQISEYWGALSELAGEVNAAGGENCFADEKCTIPGVHLLGDVVLTDDLNICVPLVADSDATIELDGHTLGGKETLLRVESGATVQVRNGTLKVESVVAAGTAAEIRASKLIMKNVDVIGSIDAVQGADLHLIGGSLSGGLETWGEGSVTVAGTQTNLYEINGNVTVFGDVAAEFSCCDFQSGSFAANSSVVALLSLCTFGEDTEKSGSYYVRSYAAGAPEETPERRQPEEIWRPLDVTETLIGNLNVYAMPVNTSILCYYDTEGVPVKTRLFEGETAFDAIGYRTDSGSQNTWVTADGTELPEGATLKGDTEAFPRSIRAAASGTVRFTYYLSGEEIVVNKTLRSGDDVLFAHYAPGRDVPLFFVHGTQTVERNDAAYAGYSALANAGGNANSVIVPIYLPERVHWSHDTLNAPESDPSGEIAVGEETAFTASAAYCQGYALRIVWPDGETSSATCAPRGAQMIVRFYERVGDEEQGISYVLRREYGKDMDITYGEDVSQVVSEEERMDGAYTTRGDYVFLYREYSDDALAAAQLLAEEEYMVVGDAEFAPYGGVYRYYNRTGESVSISYEGVPLGTPVVYACCTENGVLDAVKTALLASDMTPPEDDVLTNAIASAGDRGWIFLRWGGETEGSEENAVLVILLYADDDLTWYDDSGRELGSEKLTSSGGIQNAYAGRRIYSMRELGLNGQEMLYISVSLEDCSIVEWRSAA